MTTAPQDRVEVVVKMLRERIPMILDFGTQGVAFGIMVGIEDLARDVLALAAPPPEDIAGLIKWLEGQANYLEETFDCFDPPPRKAAAALRSQALEIERLEDHWDKLAYENKDLKEHIRELEAERDAIQAKTFEQCKQAIVNVRFGAPSNWGGDRPRGWHLDRPCTPEEASHHDNGCNDAFRAIRALAQSPKD